MKTFNIFHPVSLNTNSGSTPGGLVIAGARSNSLINRQNSAPSFEPINLGMPLTLATGNTNYPNNPTPDAYVHCAGDYCCSVVTYWDENWKKYVTSTLCWNKVTHHISHHGGIG